MILCDICLGSGVCYATEIPTMIDPSATKNYPSATGSIIVGISVEERLRFRRLLCRDNNSTVTNVEAVRSCNDTTLNYM